MAGRGGARGGESRSDKARPKGRPIGPSGGPHASRAARKHGPRVEKRRGGVPGAEALEPAPPPRAAVVSAFRRSTPSRPVGRDGRPRKVRRRPARGNEPSYPRRSAT